LTWNIYLLAIGRLDNLDKHRTLLPISPVAPFRKPEFGGVKKATVTYPGQPTRVEDGAELYRLTDVEMLPGATALVVKTQPSYTVLFGDPEFGPHGSPTSVWADKTKSAVSAADLQLACDAVDSVIGTFQHDFPG
jgi:hypothetical protein